MKRLRTHKGFARSEYPETRTYRPSRARTTSKSQLISELMQPRLTVLFHGARVPGIALMNNQSFNMIPGALSKSLQTIASPSSNSIPDTMMMKGRTAILSARRDGE